MEKHVQLVHVFFFVSRNVVLAKGKGIFDNNDNFYRQSLFFLYLVYNSVILVFNAKETAFVFLLFSLVPGGIFFYFLMDKTIVKDGWLYRNGFLRKNCKIRLTDITQVKRKKNLFGETLILYKNQKKIAKISARNRNVDWLQVKIAEIKKDKKKLERKK